MRQAAAAAGVRAVTRDTRVIERGKADGLFVNTAGVGRGRSTAAVEPRSVRLGDIVILSGDVGCHGIALMAERDGLAFESTSKATARWSPHRCST